MSQRLTIERIYNSDIHTLSFRTVKTSNYNHGYNVYEILSPQAE